MNRIQKIFKEKSEKIIPFITAGYPGKEYTIEMVFAAEAAGASMVEIGIPFSDPLADGPIIQNSSQIALKNGVTTSWILEIVSKIREKSEIPITLMGYINPILKYGVNEFLVDCKSSGVDGLIIPDLPIEEGGELISKAKNLDISPILLVAPNTPNARIEKISEVAGDLIYCVAILGVTGSSASSKNELTQYLDRVKDHSSCPFIVGFGIASRSDVVEINSVADGAVVGSALIKLIDKNPNPSEIVKNYIKELIK